MQPPPSPMQQQPMPPRLSPHSPASPSPRKTPPLDVWVPMHDDPVERIDGDHVVRISPPAKAFPIRHEDKSVTIIRHEAKLLPQEEHEPFQMVSVGYGPSEFGDLEVLDHVDDDHADVRTHVAFDEPPRTFAPSVPNPDSDEPGPTRSALSRSALQRPTGASVHKSNPSAHRIAFAGLGGKEGALGDGKHAIGDMSVAASEGAKSMGTTRSKSVATSVASRAKSIVSAPGAPFDVDSDALTELNAEKDLSSLAAVGGIDGLAKMLRTDTDKGIDPASGLGGYESRQAFFGKNELPQSESASFFRIMWENLQDPILILLMAAAAVSTALGAGLPEQRAKDEWVEGVAIWAAVFIVSGVGAANDYQKEKQFRRLNQQRDTIEIKVTRGGQRMLVTNKEIVVGDIVILDAGDKVVADMLVYDCQGLMIDEAALTGESDGVKKNSETDPWVRSGTQVAEGSAKGLVIAVGERSEWGRTMALMEGAGDDQTPLQDKLEVVATTVGKFGFAVALACFIALMIGWMVHNKGFPIAKINENGPVQFFLYAITIIVVAIPEGLPLAVTISLAYSMSKMLADQNFVRVLSACETMGGATAICSDKTGTLTENRMTIVEGWFAGRVCDRVPEPDTLSPEVLESLKINMAMNSKAFLIDKPKSSLLSAMAQGGSQKDSGRGNTAAAAATEGQHSDRPNGHHADHSRVTFVGSSTECAMLMMLRAWGFDYTQLREQYKKQLKKLHGFTSARKMSSCVLKHDTHYRLYNKGAAEWVLRQCSHVMNGGEKVEMTDEVMQRMLMVVGLMAKRGLRCICLSYTDYELEDFDRPFDFFDDPANVNRNLVCLAIFGIKDPVRPEVPDAVAACQNAGITVRMVTGDNIDTAKHIARDCGILTEDDHVSMEGPEFRRMFTDKWQDLQEILPRLRVLARSSPEDKLTLVKLLKEQGDVVAVTGDGTNDAPALKESNVGLAMGIAGTEVAKEAADIIILDDNFSSIVKSVLWGRSVFNNIRKFLQFQLTVNCAALFICFIGAVAGGLEPLNVLQLLWVNLIMDTMGALALATETPSPSLLDQAPNGPNEPLISAKMWKHIIVQGLYQVLVLLICLFALPLIFSRYAKHDQETYFSDNCLYQVSTHLSISIGTGAYNNGTYPDATWFCNVMMHCGFPLNPVTANTYLCPVYSTPNPVADNQQDAVCFNNATMAGTPCTVGNMFNDALAYVDSQLDAADALSQERTLSVLFNAFIWCQIFNEICSRRINDEYDFFMGLHKSPIFLAVIGITAGLQALIMQFMGYVFLVLPLDYPEWFACIAAGFGTCLVSWATRWVSRNSQWDIAVVILTARGNKRVTRTLSGSRLPFGRPGSSMSGHFTGSGRHTFNHKGNTSIAISRAGNSRIVPGPSRVQMSRKGVGATSVRVWS